MENSVSKFLKIQIIVHNIEYNLYNKVCLRYDVKYVAG